MNYKQLQNENIMLYKVIASTEEKLERIKTQVDNIIPEQVTFKDIYYIKKYIIDIIDGKDKDD